MAEKHRRHADLAKFHAMARTQSWRDDVRTGMQALLLQNQGKVNGIWASFDGQAYIIDDLLKAQGVKKGEMSTGLHGWRTGELSAHRRPGQRNLVATVAIPFEEMGVKAVEAVNAIVVKKQARPRRSPMAAICSWTRCWWSTGENQAIPEAMASKVVTRQWIGRWSPHPRSSGRPPARSRHSAGCREFGPRSIVMAGRPGHPRGGRAAMHGPPPPDAHQNGRRTATVDGRP